jgi:hypothetical protein
MFLNLAEALRSAGRSREDTFLIHPAQLSRWLDEAWFAQRLAPELPGTPVSNLPFFDPIVAALDLPPGLTPSGIVLTDPDLYDESANRIARNGLYWDHLIYAYLVESTGVFEIFAEVLRRLAVGETLNTLSPESTRWARTTEELFFRPPPLYGIGGIVSEVRPYERLNRRNVYWRMFGFDLTHPVPAQWGQPVDPGGWKKDTGLGVNADFRTKWSELLRQVWLGVENRSNTSGANATDPGYVALLCTALHDMLLNRRRGGQLAREEFAYVSTLSWFQLTIDTDTPIVRDLNAVASSPGDRLALIAQRVGMAPATRTRELLELARPMSSLLRAIELGFFNSPAQAESLYLGASPLTREMNNIIDLWQSATGERVKDRPTGNVVVSSPQPLRAPTPASPAPPARRQAPMPVGAPSGSNGGPR